MSIYCAKCGDDIDAKGQDNMSFKPGYPLCEDCYYEPKIADVFEEDDDCDLPGA